MNLLTNLFDDNWEIISINKRSLLLVIIFIALIVILLLVKMDNYYQNVFNVFENKLSLLVEREYLNRIKSSKEIIIDGIKYDYDIVDIEPIDKNYIMHISLHTSLKNNRQGSYKIYLGKERLFDFIIKKFRE